jgi:hypothetical protein
MDSKTSWDIANKIAIIITILWIPAVIVLYFSLRDKLRNLLQFNRKTYISKRLKWEESFDYSNNNWKFEIGKNEQYFELKFTKASDTAIHIYRDPPSIEGVAIAKWVYDIWNIKDASKYDMSSRTRTPKKWEIVILRNVQWNYCAIKILEIKDGSRSDDFDNVAFEYIINDSWFTDFTL